MICAIGNPFVSAYVQSDWFGKGIFWGLFALSAIAWWVLLHKSWTLFHVRRLSQDFQGLFSESAPLDLQSAKPLKGGSLGVPHPFFEIYKTLKHSALRIISRNHLFAPALETALSEADLGLIELQVHTSLAEQSKKLEQHLFILPTIVTLGPFLGLLGTVWGILVTFSSLHHKGFAAASSASMLAGLSLALATTVIGLVVAIPALIGYNYLKNANREYRRDMESFACLLLTAIELRYRRAEYAKAEAPLL